MAKSKKKKGPATPKFSVKSAEKSHLESIAPATAKPVPNPSGRKVGEEHDRRRASDQAASRPNISSVWRGPASKAVSAFRLGYLSVNTKFSLEELFGGSDFLESDAVDYVPNDVRFLNEAVQALLSESGAGPISGLRECLERYQAAQEALVACLRDTEPDRESSRIQSAEVAGLRAWRSLREECDRFLPQAHPLRAVFQMGVELAEFDRLASEAIGHGFDFPDAAPDLRHLARRAAAIPQIFRDYSSALSDLAGMVRHLDAKPHPATLCKFYENHRVGWNYRWDINDEMSIVTMARDLVSRIDTDLVKVADSEWEQVKPDAVPALEELNKNLDLISELPACAQISNNQVNPNDSDLQRLPDGLQESKETQQANETVQSFDIRWNQTSRKLTLNGKLIRTVRRGAKNIIAILDAFEAAHWAPQIDNPFPEHPELLHEERLKDGIRSLKNGMKTGSIEFVSVDLMAIRWQLVGPNENSLLTPP